MPPRPDLFCLFVFFKSVFKVSEISSYSFYIGINQISASDTVCVPRLFVYQ